MNFILSSFLHTRLRKQIIFLTKQNDIVIREYMINITFWREIT